MSTQQIEHNVPEWDMADRLRKALRVASVSSNDIADYLGVSRTSVSAYINGRTDPPRSVVIAWALATGVDFGWLATGTPSGPDGSPNRAIDDTGRYRPTVLTMAA